MTATAEKLPPTPDDINAMLCARNEELEREKADLAEQLDRAEARNDRLENAVRRARLYAGEHLSGQATPAGTAIVDMLEKALKEDAS